MATGTKGCLHVEGCVCFRPNCKCPEGFPKMVTEGCDGVNARRGVCARITTWRVHTGDCPLHDELIDDYA